MFDKTTRAKYLAQEIANCQSILTYQPKLAKLIAEMYDIQTSCDHKFVDGECTLCFKREES